MSQALSSHADAEQALRWALAGGEDYELCFTVPEINRGALEVALSHLGADYTCIGQIGPLSGRHPLLSQRRSGRAGRAGSRSFQRGAGHPWMKPSAGCG